MIIFGGIEKQRCKFLIFNILSDW